MKTVRQVQGTLRLLAQLSLFAATTLAPVAATGALVSACADENDPATWVKRLDDPGHRGGAIKRLSEFFEDKMARSDRNRAAPEVKAFLDVAVEPLTKVYVAGGLDDKTRTDLLKFIADTRDVRSMPALKKALDGFEEGKTDDETRFVCETLTILAKEGKLTDQGVIDSLWTVFEKFHLSSATSGRLMKDLHEAILTVKSPSYITKAMAKLAAPVNPDSVDSMKDQVQFWQLTSVQLLRDLKATQAVKPLVEVLVTPTKQDLNATVLMALLKMPKEAEPVLIAALNGTDPEIAKAGASAKDKLNLGFVSDALAKISRPAGRDAVLAALATADTDTTRTWFAQSLFQFPADPRSEPAFLAAYKKIGNDSVAEGMRLKAHYVLTQIASKFYDPTLVPWLIKESIAAPEDAGKLAAYGSAVHVYTAAQKKDIDGLITKLTRELPKDVITILQRNVEKSHEVLGKCGEDAGCYLKVLDEKIAAQPPGSNAGAVKATYMAAIYGGGANAANTRAELAKRVEKVSDAETRLSMLEAIDHLAQQGDTGVADTLEKVVAADQAKGAKDKFSTDDAATKVAMKLRARATP